MLNSTPRSAPICGAVIALLAALAPTSASAAGYSTDIELVRPEFSAHGQFGLESPYLDVPGTIRVGFLGQYEKDPLILYEYGAEAGSVVGNRGAAQLGLSWDFSDRIGATLVVPTGYQWGTEIPDLDGDGTLLGDIGLGGRVLIGSPGPLDIGVRALVGVPSGTKAKYISERGVRVTGGLMGEARFGPIALLGDVGFTGRSPIETQEEFTLGSELALTGGIRYDLRPGRVAVMANYVSRNGFSNFFGGEAENPGEVVGGFQYRPIDSLRLDLGGGKGLADGYGTTAFRVLAGVTFIKRPITRLPPEPPPIIIAPAPPEPPKVDIEEILVQKEEWKEGELAKPVEGEIIIRDPIQFEFNTDRILPVSIPTLEYVAKLMNENAQIGYLTIEGHASEEGSFEYNYDLAERRSRAVWRQLILSGVHPDRIAYRGMGEVQPKVEGTDEESLATNRRVEFHIDRQFTQLEYEQGDIPEYGTTITLPWNGQKWTVVNPVFNPEFGKTDAEKRAMKEEATYDPNQFRVTEPDEGGDGASGTVPVPVPPPAPDGGEDDEGDDSDVKGVDTQDDAATPDDLDQDEGKKRTLRKKKTEEEFE